MGPQSRSSCELDILQNQALARPPRTREADSEFVSHVLKFCLLKTLRWEKIDAIVTSQETEHEIISTYCCHVDVVARKMSKKWSKRASKISIQTWKLLVASDINSTKY